LHGECTASLLPGRCLPRSSKAEARLRTPRVRMSTYSDRIRTCPGRMSSRPAGGVLDSSKVRIAISGTHCSGKTTLVEDFIAAHRDYLHEPEPYEWLEEAYGEGMGDEPTADDFRRQLEVSVDRLRSHGLGVRVVAERSPVDFLAYLLALVDLERSGRDCEAIASSVELAAAGLANVDLLVVLPLNERDGIVAPEAEDLALRDAMNDRLVEIITADDFALFGSGSPRVVEIQGTRQQRLRLLEQAVLHPLSS
jgi:hypothetical protein